LTKPTIPLETLLADLHSPNITTRDNAARELGKTRDPRAVDALLLDLQAEDWKVRRNAAQALGEARDKRAVEPLLTALDDHIATVRCRAAVALGRLKDPRAIEPLIAAWLTSSSSDLARDALAAVRKFGKASVPALLNVLQLMPQERKRVLRVLGEFNHPAAVDALLAALQDSDPQIRFVVAETLTNVQDQRAREPLRAALPGSDLQTQAMLIRALGNIHAVEAVPDMLRLLQDDRLFGERQGIYRAVAEALEQLGNIPPALAAIIHNDLLRMAGMLTEAQSIALAERLNAMTQQFDDWRKILGQPPGSAPKFVLQMGEMVNNARPTQRDALTGLLFLLNSSEPLTRIGALLLLPWYTDARALEPLRQATQDADANVRVAAQWAFAALEHTLYYRRKSQEHNED
jgi:HEAT repeat protein